jgi:branched-subunit amino acid transport protein
VADVNQVGWILVAGVAFVSFLTRALFLLPANHLRLSAGIQRALRFAPAAALMAIIAPDMLAMQGEPWISIANPRLAGGLAGFVIALTTRSILLTIAGGMLAFTVVRLTG